MTIREAITLCDSRKPNQYKDEDKLRWLSELDGTVQREILETHEGEHGGFAGYARTEGVAAEEDPVFGRTLLVPEPYSDMYLKYLVAQIDFSNAEFARYNNSAAMFNTAYRAYASFYNRKNLPLQHNRVRFGAPRAAADPSGMGF